MPTLTERFTGFLFKNERQRLEDEDGRDPRHDSHVFDVAPAPLHGRKVGHQVEDDC